ncbi:phospholipase D family protein [Variovorax sp. J22R133]|uniref:phospholipase D family protein n=1 Tax=Variovorax brevis TaxID=3053503 RepID=UPI00257769F9|nr:phospholipase D family protein [Variovorax sp. J22R133]MDM0114462.1 phospholipase D family protein [Variovorax sp. J22R133]
MSLRLAHLLPRWLAACVLIAWLCGCAGLPPRSPVAAVQAIAASPDNALGRAAASLDKNRDGLSAFRTLIQASFALDARLELIRRAQSSIDLQTYLVGRDKTGLLILRELRDAARRGVRVRLLLDDFYTSGLDPALQGLSAEPNVEVRLFNPFSGGRAHSETRFLEFVGNFSRLNHRMHNKLFIADGAMAIAGGRNLADEYFLRSNGPNFIDFELLMAGPVVAQSAAIFDRYWNSDVVYPLRQMAPADAPADALRDSFESLTADAWASRPAPLTDLDFFGDPSLGTQLDGGDLPWIRAHATAAADSPTKALGDPPTRKSLADRSYELIDAARSQVLMVSPYFIPGDDGMERIRSAHQRGVRFTVVTNSLADSDEPLVNINYNRYRVELLKLGVDLREVSTRQLTRNPELRRLLRKARGRMHAKLALIDREWVLVGSMNSDPRSAHLNTEFGVSIQSFELAHAVIYGYQLDDIEGVYRVVLAPDGKRVRWIGTGDAENEELDDEPDSSLLTRLQLLLFSWFVPTDQL